MIDLNRFHSDEPFNNVENEQIDPDLVAKQRRQMITKIKSDIRERQLLEINSMIKNK